MRFCTDCGDMMHPDGDDGYECITCGNEANGEASDPRYVATTEQEEDVGRGVIEGELRDDRETGLEDALEQDGSWSNSEYNGNQ
jgi:DNA-directed RNA polymerase subunit M/transcription elongation factor TFIIS